MSKNYSKILFIFVSPLILSYFVLFGNLSYKNNSQAQTNSSLIDYTVPNKFSLLIPPEWVPEGKLNSDSTYFSFTNYKHDLRGETVPSDAIKTEVSFIEKKLDVVLQTRFQQANQYHESITKRGDLTIDGQPAVRVWYEGGGWNYPNEISSYIPYAANQTVVISSYYNGDNSDAVDTIQRIHWSFRHLKKAEITDSKPRVHERLGF